MPEIDPTLLRQLWNRVTGLVVGVAAVIAIVTPLVRPDFITASIAVAYLELVVIVLLVGSLWVLLVNVSEERNLREWTLPLRQNPVNVEKKVLTIDVTEGGPDEIEHTFEFTPAFNEPINEFKALIGSDRHLSWEELDIQCDGGEVEQDAYERRDWGDITRFIFPIRFDAISGDQFKTITYFYEVDAFDVEGDSAFTVIRSLTNRAVIDITFPEGWKPTMCNLYEGVDEDRSLLDGDNVERDTRDGRWFIRWEGADPAIEDYYELEYRAERIPDG